MSCYLREVRSSIESFGVAVIQLEAPIESEQKLTINLAPDVKNFGLLIRSLEISTIFEINYKFSTDYMLLDFESSKEKSSDIVNLTTLSSDFNQYEEFFGQDFNTTYFAVCQDKIYSIDFYDPWWDDFKLLRGEVVNQFSRIQEETFQKENAEQSELRENLINELYALVQNKPFRRFVLKEKQTHRTITKYAIELIPNLVELPEGLLKKAVVNCIDCIKINKSIKPQDISIDFR